MIVTVGGDLKKQSMINYVIYTSSILHLMMPALEHIKMGSDEKKRKQIFGLTDKPLVVNVMLDYMMDVLLLPYKYV